MVQVAAEMLDSMETRPDSERRADLLARAADALLAARANTPFWHARLPEIPDGPLSPETLAALPVLRKAEIPALQAESPPFGGLAELTAEEFPRLFLSPGPICEPGARGDDGWGAVRALRAAGFGPGDIVLNTFGYHLTPAGLLMDDAARALGCAVIPAGSSSTELVVQAMRAYRPTCYVGTPDHLNILLEAADAKGVDVNIRSAAVSGAAVSANLRAILRNRGIDSFEMYGTAELGIIAYETRAHAGMVLNEDLLVEIVAPGTGDPLPDGEVGELIVTALRRDYPLFRFATGDLSAIQPGVTGCGRTNQRLRGWLGRADDTVKVKGIFLRPDMVSAIVADSEIVTAGRFIVEREGERDQLIFEVEGPLHDDAATEAIILKVREFTRLRCTPRWCDGGTIPRDRPIEDRREFSASG